MLNCLKNTGVLSTALKDCRTALYWQYGLLLCISIVSGCIFHFYNPASGLTILFILLAIFAGPGLKRLIILIVIFGIWTLYLHFAFTKRPSLAGEVHIEGRVLSFPQKNKYQTFNLKSNLGKVSVQCISCRILLQPGQTVMVSGNIIIPRVSTNPGQFNYAAFLKTQNISYILEADSVRILTRAPLISRLIGSLRKSFEDSIERNIRPEVTAVVRASILGSRDQLSADTKEQFANSGMMHLLAISGLHVGIMAAILIGILMLFRLPKKAAICMTGVFLLIYIPLTDGPISVIRSVIMFWCVALGILWERPRYSLNNLAVSCILCLIFMPYQILSLGFQLSFTATFFLIYYSSIISNISGYFKALPPFIKGALTTVTASALLFFATMPILIQSLHQISPLAILGNIITILLASGLVFTAVLCLLFDTFSNFAGLIMGETCSVFADLLVFSVHKISRIDGAFIYWPDMNKANIFLLYSLLLILPYSIKIRKLKTLLLLFALLFTSVYTFERVMDTVRHSARVTFIDVDQGDAILCQLPGPYNVLIDAGKGSRRKGSGKYNILPYLKYRGINRLHQVVITHPDLDHYGGLLYLLPRVSVERIYHNSKNAKSKSWKELQEMSHNMNIPFKPSFCGDTLYYSKPISMIVLSPCSPNQFSDRNEGSLVIQLNLHTSKILFTGDIEQQAERWLSRNVPVKSDIIKLAHHGSRTSSSLEFLQAVKANTAIISAGRQNRYGMPHQEILSRLEHMGIHYFNTQQTGAIIYNSSRFDYSWRPTLLPEMGN